MAIRAQQLLAQQKAAAAAKPPVRPGPLPQATDPVRPSGIKTATPISVTQQGQGESYARFGQEAPIAQGVARGAANVPNSGMPINPVKSQVAAGVARGAANVPTNVPPGKKVFSRGGKVKSKSSYGSGGGVKSSASKRGDGIAQRGKTKGRMV